MSNKKILWVDDEIDSLEPQVMSLKLNGYDLTTATNGDDAIAAFSADSFDLVLLDENMPGKSGLETLQLLKQIAPSVPMVMVTKNEQQDFMEDAYKCADDFLVKPVTIPQLRSTVTRILNGQAIKEGKVVDDFNRTYLSLSQKISACNVFNDWASLYRDIVSWETQLPDSNALEMLLDLKREANIAFSKFVKANYVSWFSPNSPNAPLLSHRILSTVIKPLLKNGEKVAFVVIDNFRLDQWEVIRPSLEREFLVKTDLCCSILPTSTQFSRNAIFSGLLPADIAKMHPDYWKADDEESFNQHERELLADYFDRQRMHIENSYYKVGSNDSGEDYTNGFNGSKKHKGYANNQLNALVFSFVDALSHATTDSRTLRDLITDDKAYRKVTRLWFTDGIMLRTLRLLRDKGFKIVLTTDHGAIRVSSPIDISGPADLNRNLRYKVAKNISYNPKDVFELTDSRSIDTVGLPKASIADKFIFALKDDFFLYKNNRNDYLDRYANSFQHGGISLEEMILPLVTLQPKP